MSALDKFAKQFNKITTKKGDPWLERIAAWTGNYAGVVNTSRTGFINVRVDGQVVEVFNAAAPLEPNIPVTVGRHKDQPQLWQVIGKREVWSDSASASMLHHGLQHSFLMPDETPIHRKQIIQLTVRVFDAANFIVIVYGGMAGNIKVNTQTQDLSSYVISSGAKFVGIEADDNGDLSLNDGDVFAAPGVATKDDFPVPVAGKYIIAWVRFYEGQATLSNDDIIVPWPPFFNPQAYSRVFLKSAAPTEDDDSSLGYRAGDVWIDQSNDATYEAIHVDIGAAVWNWLDEPFTPGSGVDYIGAKAAIEALGGVAEGAIAYADDTNEFGAYNGTTWDWISKTYFDTIYAALGHSHSYIPTSYLDTDGTLAANSDSKVASQKATKTYVDNSVTGLLELKGSTDCSSNPNYPAALKGDAYYVTVAGKIGGASGKSVDIGDVYAALADNAGGTEASVGTSWFVLEHNLAGALLSANNLSDVASTSSARSNLGLGDAATKNVGTGSGDVAAGNKGVTNGDSHNHAGGDGGPVNHDVLENAGSTTHADIDMAINNGWISRSETWTRTGNHTFTVSGDLTNTFRKGTKVQYSDGGLDYGVVASSSHAAGTTTVNLIPNSDYAMAATTIIGTYISYIENPVGWPDWFNYSVSWSSLSNPQPVLNNGTLLGKWKVTAKTIFFQIYFTAGNTTTFGTGNWYFSLPADATSSSTGYEIGPVYALDFGTMNYYGFWYLSSGTNLISCLRDNTAQPFYSLAPQTWAVNDILSIKGFYQY